MCTLHVVFPLDLQITSYRPNLQEGARVSGNGKISPIKNSKSNRLQTCLERGPLWQDLFCPYSYCGPFPAPSPPHPNITENMWKAQCENILCTKMQEPPSLVRLQSLGCTRVIHLKVVLLPHTNKPATRSVGRPVHSRFCFPLSFMWLGCLKIINLNYISISYFSMKQFPKDHIDETNWIIVQWLTWIPPGSIPKLPYFSAQHLAN